jgi:RNA-directed DNA polymerase
MQTSLERIAEKAANNSKHRFQNLYRLLNEELLMNAWRRLNKKSAPGIDGVTYKEYENNLHNNIIKLADSAKEKTYRAKLVRRQYIPKGNGKMRPLGIPILEDKLLQHGVTQILQAIYEKDFLPCSFGYRPNRGATDAVKDVRNTLSNKWAKYVVEADIKGFFDNLDHEWIVKMLEQRIDDKALISLIKKWLKAGILDTDGKTLHPITGSPQGGIISPMLANIYLHYVLILWFEKAVKKHCKGKAHLCVYADDFVCVFEYDYDAQRFYKALSKRFEKFGLTLAEEKTKLIWFNHYSNEKFDFLGFEFRPTFSSKRVKIRTSRSKLRQSIKNVKEWIKTNRHKKRCEIFKELNVKLRGYYNYYGLKGNHKGLSEFYWIVLQSLHKWLNRRSQRKSYTVEKFVKVLEYYKIQKPRIMEI